MRDPAGVWQNQRLRLLPFVALGLLTLLVFGRVLSFGFFQDDLYLMFGLRDWGFWDKSVYEYWRPLWTLWMCAQYQVFGLNPHAMHAANLTLCLVASWLAYDTLVALGTRRPVALATVSIWLLLAGNAYAGAWISAANDPIALSFLVLATRIWLTSPGGSPSLGRAALASALWLLSMFAKEIAFAWPVAAVVVAGIRWRRDAPARRPSAASLVFPLGLALAALVLYFGMRLRVHGLSGGFSTGDLPNMGGHLHGNAPVIMAAGRAFHLAEALVYNFLPLDLFRSWPGLLIGTLIALALAAMLLAASRRALARPPLVYGLLWMVLFSLHGAFTPHPRTLYISTLGLAFVMAHTAADAERFRTRLLPLLLFIAYIGIHIMLGQGVVDYHSPASIATQIRSSKLLLGDDPRITPEKKAYLAQELRYARTEELAQLPLAMEENAIWRRLLQEGFRKAVGRSLPGAGP